MSNNNEPKVFDIPVCELCIQGKAGECHSPGCSFFMFPAPPEGANCLADFVVSTALQVETGDKQ